MSLRSSTRSPSSSTRIYGRRPEARSLRTLAANIRNIVCINLRREGAFFEQQLGHIKDFGMNADYAGFVHELGEPTWSNFTDSLDLSCMAEVLAIFKYYTERTTCSHIDFSLFQCQKCLDLFEHDLARKRPIAGMFYLHLRRVLECLT